MALYDSADLLARCKREARVASTAAYPADDDWYAWLTEAQEHWVGQIAVHVPWVMMGDPTQITSADSNETYDFPDDGDSVAIEPLAVEIYASKSGRPLRAGTYWDENSDYVWEGNKIRFARGKTKTFTDGPYARWVTPSDLLDASNEPTLYPKRARKLLVYRACALWAASGGERDPSTFYELENRTWVGYPEAGDLGLLGELKQQNPLRGTEAIPARVSGVLQFVNTGVGYTAA